MRRMVSLVLALAASMSASDALACVVRQPIDARIRGHHADTIVLAVVRRAEYGMPYVEGISGRPWKGTAMHFRTLEGKTDERMFRLSRTGFSVACDDGIPAPNPGSIWVLYVRNDARLPEGYPMVLGYPLEIARTADPRLTPLLEHAGYESPGRNE